VRLRFLRDQELLRDLHLLELEIAREADHLHAVDQRTRDRVERVARRQEQDLREVEVDLEVVVLERVVLLRIEHLEERRRRIATEVHPELVDLVEEEHRVLRARTLHPLDDPAGERADVRSPVATDLGLVPNAAERHADELPSERARDRLPERGLPHARRSDEAENRALELTRQLEHRDVLEDPLLDLLQAVVILVEDALDLLEIGIVLGRDAPRQARPASRRSSGRRSPRAT
jgi:hypothetical protein